MAEPLIEVINASAAHRHRLALRDVSLAVERGELLAVIGPNGAGKTTLLRLVNGLSNLVSGRVRVLGMNPYGADARPVRTRVGYIAQVRPFDCRLPITVEESVMTGRYGRLGLLRRPGSACRRAVADALEQAGAAHLARRPLGHLSGGEYQRVAIARALAQEPDILLCDEPTTSLDPDAQESLMALVEGLHDRLDITTLYVTHSMPLIPQRCRRVLALADGRIRYDGPPSAVGGAIPAAFSARTATLGCR